MMIFVVVDEDPNTSVPLSSVLVATLLVRFDPGPPDVWTGFGTGRFVAAVCTLGVHPCKQRVNIRARAFESSQTHDYDRVDSETRMRWVDSRIKRTHWNLHKRLKVEYGSVDVVAARPRFQAFVEFLQWDSVCRDYVSESCRPQGRVCDPCRRSMEVCGFIAVHDEPGS